MGVRMLTRLPDVARAEASAILSPLNEVGMSDIDLPLTLDEPGVAGPVPARAAISVDLPQPQTKGIHMSRLYRLLDAFSGRQVLGPDTLRRLLARLIQSHTASGSPRPPLPLGLPPAPPPPTPPNS